ncbi:MAG: hypothetical protein R3342_04745 [Lutibacter sp.]|uniref:HYC_CC_PP family protein n=1 Tax=Lutibacter sp. TaxID=1925666 RepID=UPI00299CF3D6|nr:hypothetical protein [Lutibacter sp.]MDX1828837.1 hypothetical protein [Lutibacter sp.]
MREIFKKIGAVLMSLVVLFSTMSFTVSEHFCGDHLVSAAIFSKASSCGMDIKKQGVDKESCTQTDNCCKDVMKQFNSQNVVKTNFAELTNNQQFFVVAFTYSYLNLFEGLEQNIIPFKNYNPPLLVTNIQVVDQVFII